ncbi:two-component system, LytTR family, sensor histidine kinase AgrC [Enterococcus sp. AZ194]
MLLSIYMSMSHIIGILFSYLIIDRNLFTTKRKFLYFLATVGIVGVVAYHYNFLGEIFLLVFLILLNLRREMAVQKILLLILFPFSIQSAVIVALRPLYSLIPSFEEGGFTPYMFIKLGSYAIIFIVSWGVTNYLLPYILRKKQEKKTLLLLIIVFLGVQIEWLVAYLTEYSSDFFIIIFIVLLLFTILIYFSVKEITEKQALKVEVERQKIEKEYMSAYSDEVKGQYEELRKFKHDYVNILSSLDYFIKTKDLDRVERYFKQTILPTQTYIQQSNTYFQQLQNIESEEIKSILAVKLTLAKEKGILAKLEVPDKISNRMSADSIVLVRMLGIILDNSIEEVSSLPDGKIRIGLLDVGQTYLFVVENSVRKNIEKLAILTREGFSTKGEGRGLGLSNLNKLNKKEPNVSLETIVTEQFFVQKLTIQKGGC